MDGGLLAGVLDVTTTELCDDLVGGVLSAGPDRLEAAGRAGLPQVVSLGALDMVNFGARDTVPPQFEDRNLYVHNPSVTLMRTTPEECAELGRRIARKLSAATGPVSLFVPLARRVDDRRRGTAVPRPGGRRGAVRRAARGPRRPSVELIELDHNVNDAEFAAALADKLDSLPGGSSMTGEEARAKLRATLDGGRRDHRRGRGHRPVGQVRRGGRHGPDHHLQLRPLPDGRARLAGRADALRRRQRDRHGDGPARCCRSCATRRCSRASAAPTRSG